MELRAGLEIDRYVLIEQLGEGGQGAVWKASDPLAPNRPCALKLVPVVAGRPNDLERVRREARALAQLDHPSLVRSVGLFEDLKHGVLGIAMELVRGTSLRQLAADGRLDPSEKIRVLEHVAHALAYLHDSGVVHRDVKLDNVLVRESFWEDPTRPEGVKVVDLGIAAVAGADQNLTREGTVVGTVPFLAPEQLDPATFDGDQSSPRIDVFSFGVMGWLLLSGRHPTGLPATSSAVDYTRAYRAHAVPSKTAPDSAVDDPWRGILGRCLEPIPSERLADGRAVVEAIAGKPRDSVVVRPSGDAPHQAAAATSPAMFDATVLAERPPTGSTAAASTVELGPAKDRPRSTSWVLPFATVVFAVGVGGVGAWLMREPARSLAPTAKPEQSTPVGPTRPRAVPAPTPADAAFESGTPEVDARANALPSACSEGCPSGRGCGPQGCDAPLDAADVYALRLGGVDANSEGASLLATYLTAEVCVSVTGRTNPPVCMPLIETADAGVTRQHLRVTYSELLTGLDVSVKHVVPGAGEAKLAHKSGVTVAADRRDVICKGIVIEGLATEGDVSVARVVLFLDDPAAQPARCP